jgi:sRNA-binding carbon storage regulator CsrA
MLVVSRKQLRSVAVGDPNGCYLILNVTMLEIQGVGVRLGLEVNIPRGGEPDCPTGPAMGKAGAQ